MKRWWILKDRLRHGPFTESELVEHLRTRSFAPTDFVAREDSQSVTQLSHRTIREVLAHLDLPEATIDHVLPVVLLEPRSSFSNDVKHDEAAGPIDPIPKIRDLLSRIEAVELVESSERAVDAGIRIQPIESARRKNLIGSIADLFGRLKPAYGFFAILSIGYWFYEQHGVVDREPAVESAPSSSVKMPKVSGAAASSMPSRIVAPAPRVKLPSTSQRSGEGDGGTATASSDDMSDEALVGDQSQDAVNLGVATSRRERLRKLRKALVPGSAVPSSDEPIPGVNSESNEDQAQYDEDRYIASEPDSEEDAPPYVEDQEVDSLTDEGQDNAQDVEYQE